MYLRAVVERLSGTAMHACRASACVFVCVSRERGTGPETTTIHPHRTWTAKSVHKRPHTPFDSKWSSTCYRECRSEQGVETDGGETGEYA